ncbi:uncharacterized protein LOC144345864 [Saccoglossus kowalevskii]
MGFARKFPVILLIGGLVLLWVSVSTDRVFLEKNRFGAPPIKPVQNARFNDIKSVRQHGNQHVNTGDDVEYLNAQSKWELQSKSNKSQNGIKSEGTHQEIKTQLRNVSKTNDVLNISNAIKNTPKGSHTVTQNSKDHTKLRNESMTLQNTGKKSDDLHKDILKTSNANTLDELHPTPSYTKDQIQSRYLLPLVIYGHQGPNSIYHSYRFAINYALNQGRSVVQIPFRSKSYGIMKRFNETFDVEKLSQLLPVKTMDDFRRDCGEILSFESLVNLQIPHVYDRSQKQPAFRKEGVIPYLRNDPSIHENLLGINLPIIPDRGISNFKSVMHYYSSENVPCIAVLLMDSKRILTTDVNAVDNYKNIDKYLTRAPYIQDMADKVVKQFCNGDAFVALHWRNMGAEGCSGKCEKIIMLRMNMPKLADLVYKYINARGIKCLYILAPGGAEDFVYALNQTALVLYNQNTIRNHMPVLSQRPEVISGRPRI